MDIILKLEQMSNEEKIQAMETIWDDLYKKADSLMSPTWHKNILQKREEQIKKDQDEFMDWDEAKNLIKNNYLSPSRQAAKDAKKG